MSQINSRHCNIRMQRSSLLVKLVIPVGPKRLLHPDPVPTEVVQGGPVDLPPEGGVVRGIAGQHARETGEECAVRRRRLGAEEKWIVAQQSSFSMFKASQVVRCLYLL